VDSSNGAAHAAGLTQHTILIEKVALSELVGKLTIIEHDRIHPILIHPQADGKFRISRFSLKLEDGYTAARLSRANLEQLSRDMGLYDVL
jgi:hypothetical protein